MTKNKPEGVELPSAMENEPITISPEQEQANKEQQDVEELQMQIQEKSEKLAELLKEEPAMALQPFLNMSQFGIRPDVAVVPMPKNEPKQEENNDQEK